MLNRTGVPGAKEEGSPVERRHTADGPQSMAEADVKVLRAQLMAIEYWRTIRHTMPLQYITTFLLVATEEGLGVQEYAEKAGVAQSVMSRHLLDIGERNRYLEPGFGLVHIRPDPLNLRRHQVFLTNKGKALAHNIVRALRRA